MGEKKGKENKNEREGGRYRKKIIGKRKDSKKKGIVGRIERREGGTGKWEKRKA